LNASTWNILIVDDSLEIVEVLSFTLQGSRFDGRPSSILRAHTKEEAARILSHRDDIDLAVIDAKLVHSDDGFQLAHWIRYGIGNQRIRLILYTGHLHDETFQQWVLPGLFDAYLPKQDSSIEVIRNSVDAALASLA